MVAISEPRGLVLASGEGRSLEENVAVGYDEKTERRVPAIAERDEPPAGAAGR